jgi:hypothetical protein
MLGGYEASSASLAFACLLASFPQAPDSLPFSTMN